MSRRFRVQIGLVDLISEVFESGSGESGTGKNSKIGEFRFVFDPKTIKLDMHVLFSRITGLKSDVNVLFRF